MEPNFTNKIIKLRMHGIGDFFCIHATKVWIIDDFIVWRCEPDKNRPWPKMKGGVQNVSQAEVSFLN